MNPKAVLFRCEHVKHWMEDIAKLNEEVEPGKQSGVIDPACPCRAVEAHPQKRTKTTQQT
jgi:hypothetical protein